MPDQQPADLRQRRADLYRAYETPDQAWTSLARFAEETGATIRVYVVLSAMEAQAILVQLARCAVSVHTADVNQAGNVFSLRLSRQWGRAHRHESSGQVLCVRSMHPAVYHLISDFEGDFWRNVVRYALTRTYPQLSQPSLSTNEIRDLLERVARRFGASPAGLRVTQLGYSSRIPDPNARRARDMERTWTDLSIEGAFRQAEEEDAVVTRAEFEVLAERGPTCRGYVSYDGEVRFWGGCTVLHEEILEPIASAASATYRKMDGRERVQAHGYASRPFFIEFAADLLAKTDERKRLLAALGRMANTSQSVIHANPYLHVSILDYIEGTSCDLYVLSGNRISIVPQTQTSATSLTRLYTHI